MPRRAILRGALIDQDHQKKMGVQKLKMVEKGREVPAQAGILAAFIDCNCVDGGAVPHRHILAQRRIGSFHHDGFNLGRFREDAAKVQKNKSINKHAKSSLLVEMRRSSSKLEAARWCDLAPRLISQGFVFSFRFSTLFVDRPWRRW